MWMDWGKLVENGALGYCVASTVFGVLALLLAFSFFVLAIIGANRDRKGYDTDGIVKALLWLFLVVIALFVIDSVLTVRAYQVAFRALAG